MDQIDIDLLSRDDTDLVQAGKVVSALTDLTDATNAIIRLLRGVATPPPNQAPTAVITISSQSNLAVSLSASSSSDPDGAIAGYTWDFGDGQQRTGIFASHTYGAAGTYMVQLTVTDNSGAAAVAMKNITVSAPASSGGGGGSTGGDSGGTGTTQTGTGVTSYATLSGSDFSTRVNAAGSNKVALPTGTYTFNDFSYSGGGTSPTAFWFGAKITAAGLLGAGSNYTTIQMNPNTSTKSSDVPAQGTGSSNQLQYIYLTAAGATVDGCKIVGTVQGHLYNGLRFQAVANPTLSNSTLLGLAPGNAGSPPGETFGVNFQGCTGTVTVTNVTGDGQNTTAALMGSNNSSATYNITNYVCRNSKYSAAWASWEHKGVMNFRGFVVQNSARAFNAERLAGVVNFYDPVWSQPFSGHSDVNPTYEPGWTGGVLNFYFTNQAAWQAFTAVRTTKTITAVSNSTSVSNGLIKGSVINVYIGGVKQPQASYVTWTGI